MLAICFYLKFNVRMAIYICIYKGIYGLSQVSFFVQFLTASLIPLRVTPVMERFGAMEELHGAVKWWFLLPQTKSRQDAKQSSWKKQSTFLLREDGGPGIKAFWRYLIVFRNHYCTLVTN